jgi:Uma2 family endonuclease
MPPTDPESSEHEGAAFAQLWNWAQAQGRGRVSGPSGGFYFADGSRRSPDAAWFDAERWRRAKTPGARFPVFAPDFVIEVRSPNDKPRLLREKI